MVLPCADVPPRPFNYNAVYANMKRFEAQVFSHFPDVTRIHYGFGLVVLPGKMLINGILLQCPSVSARRIPKPYNLSILRN